MNVQEQKRVLRTEMMQRRNSLPQPELRRKSELICDRLLTLPAMARAGHVFCYVSCKSEVETHGLIRRLLHEHRIVSVPWIDQSQRQLIPSRIQSIDQDLAPGSFGILEPLNERLAAVDMDEIDVVIAPGLAFSEYGWRIGYGGGYYDRLLNASGKLACGLAFELQIVPDLPYNSCCDVPVHCVVTEERVIFCRTFSGS